MAESKKENFTEILNNQSAKESLLSSSLKTTYGWDLGPNSYTLSAQKIIRSGSCDTGTRGRNEEKTVSIQMEPILKSPLGFGKYPSDTLTEPSRPISPSSARLHSENPHLQRQPQRFSEIHKLEALRDYNKFYLDYDNPSYINVIGGGSPESNNVIMQVQTKCIGVPEGRNKISNSETSFMDANSTVLFKNERLQHNSRVLSDDIALGDVCGDSDGCVRFYMVTCYTSNLTFKLYPQVTKAKKPFCLCNCCLTSEYFIYNTITKRRIGKITCGEKIEIKIGSSSGSSLLDTSSKAVLLAASLTIYELYFALRPGWGNVGEAGGSNLFSTFSAGIPCLIFMILIVSIFVLVKFL